MDDIKAIIAEDEKVLRDHLRTQLRNAWPELRIVGEARNGLEAVALIERHKPHIAFLDIRMPGLSGMEVAGKIPGSCRVVFVTAYDEYAVKAFENEALDYLLKPVTPERLAKTVERLKRILSTPLSGTFESLKKVERVLAELNEHQTDPPLRWVRVQQGDNFQLISVDEIFYFKASDKYTVVRTETEEYLIRKPVKSLIRELDSQHFWQIHRGTIVNVSYVAGVSRSLTGKGVLRLRNMSDTLRVSQAHMHLFRQM
jgi:DNA-binding LytR/AlgR family response regulator